MSAVGSTQGLHFWLAGLLDPAAASAWTLQEWEFAIRQARRLRLLARLGHAITSSPTGADCPPQATRHLRAELQLSQWRCTSVRWALERVALALDGADYPRVLLKGAAYMAQNLAIGHGRLPSDADILVPKAHIAQAQASLVEAGWAEKPMDQHDRQYYHEWSHEVPPMQHPLHGVELDLHHNILPPVGRTRVDADLLLARLQPCAWPGWQVLHPVDQVLHSASHLFHDSELRDRLRDLVDLDGLLRQFGLEPGFWDELPQRARELGLGESLALALHFCCTWLGTPVPEAARRRSAALGPGAARRMWLYPLFASVLTPRDPDLALPWTQSLAAQALLARHHLGRMPLRLLVPHLWHKMRKHEDTVDPDAAPLEERQALKD
jgi:hypothetical protein